MATGTRIKEGCSFELLWTNNNPVSTSGFPSESTVDLDLSDYSAVLIVFIATANLDRQASMICIKGEKSVLTTAVPSETNTRTRLVNVFDSGVKFSSGYTGSNTAVASAIPYKIFGIKGM